MRQRRRDDDDNEECECKGYEFVPRNTKRDNDNKEKYKVSLQRLFVQRGERELGVRFEIRENTESETCGVGMGWMFR